MIAANVLSAEKVQRLSLIQVIANPETWDGKKVLVIGYLDLTFEGSELYVHQEDLEHHLLMNGVRIRASAAKQYTGKINHKYVLIVGQFHAAPKEVFHPALGTIDSITEYRIWLGSEKETGDKARSA